MFHTSPTFPRALTSLSILLAATLLAVSVTGAARPKGPPAATPAGKPVDCVELNQIRETRVRDDQTIDFILRNSKVYRNTLPYSCPQLGFEDGFSYSTSLSRLCSVDTITVLLHLGGIQRGATCGLGQFQPVNLTGG